MTCSPLAPAFSLAARHAQPHDPVHLEGEDPDVFSLYLNCIHSGMDAIRADGQLLGKRVATGSEFIAMDVKQEPGSEQTAKDVDNDPEGTRFEALIKLHLLADKLQDLAMMNIVVDEIVRMIEDDGLVPAHINLVYESTSPGAVLRTLLRDVYLHEAESAECLAFLRSASLHHDFWRDISLQDFNLKDTERSISEVYGLSISRDKCANRCYYHQHSDEHPPCVSARSG